MDQTGFSKIVLILIIVIFIGAVYWYWGDEIKLTLQTWDWKTYYNDEYGFKFKYPKTFYIGGAGLIIDDMKIEALNADLQDPDRGPGFIISDGFIGIGVDNGGLSQSQKNYYKTLAEQINSLPSGNSNLVNYSSELLEQIISVNGIKGLVVIHRDYPDTSRYAITATFYAKNYNRFSLYDAFDSNLTSNEIFESLQLETFNQILPTFNFTKN